MTQTEELIQKIRAAMAQNPDPQMATPPVQEPPLPIAPEMQQQAAPPPAPDPRIARIQQLRQQAAQLEQQAQPQQVEPQGLKQNLVAGVLGAFHPGGYSNMIAQRQGQERQRQQDTYTRMNQALGRASQEEQTVTEQQKAAAEQSNADRTYGLNKMNTESQVQDRNKPHYSSGAQGIYRDDTGQVTTPAPVVPRNLDPNSREAQENRAKYGPQPYHAPTQPDYEWVKRGGKAIQIQKGTTQPGDEPWDPVADRQKEPPPSPYSAERALRTIDSVDALLKKVGPTTVGLGSASGMIPGTPARDFKAELETLKSNIITNELTQMRAASRTGGALGQVSDKEAQFLSSALGAIDPGQSPQNFREQLAKVKASVERWQKAQELAKTPVPGGGRGGGKDPLGIR